MNYREILKIVKFLFWVGLINNKMISKVPFLSCPWFIESFQNMFFRIVQLGGFWICLLEVGQLVGSKSCSSKFIWWNIERFKNLTNSYFWVRLMHHCGILKYVFSRFLIAYQMGFKGCSFKFVRWTIGSFWKLLSFSFKISWWTIKCF